MNVSDCFVQESSGVFEFKAGAVMKGLQEGFHVCCCFCCSKWSASASLGKQKSCLETSDHIFREWFIQELERQTVLVIHERREGAPR